MLALQGRGNNRAISWNNCHHNMIRATPSKDKLTKQCHPFFLSLLLLDDIKLQWNYYFLNLKRHLVYLFGILCYVNGIVGNCQNYPGFCLSDCSTAIRGASWEDLRCWCAHKGHIGVSQSWRCPWGYRLFLCKTHQKSEAASCLKGLFDGSILYVLREIPPFGHTLPFWPSTTTILMCWLYSLCYYTKCCLM